MSKENLLKLSQRIDVIKKRLKYRFRQECEGTQGRGGRARQKYLLESITTRFKCLAWEICSRALHIINFTGHLDFITF